MGKDKIKLAFDAAIITSIIAIFYFAFSITLITYDASGANITNSTVMTRVNVTNTQPFLYEVQVTPSTTDLNPGGTVNVICNGSVYETNGVSDIRNVSARLYHTDYGDGTSSDNNFRYINYSCRNSSGVYCQMKDGSPNNASCICSFSVQYYANNGSWQCNMTVGDSYSLNSTNWSNTVTVNTVLGIDMPSMINFGNMSVTETSSHIRENVTNWGNVPINTSIRGYGGLIDNNNLSMICSVSNITNTYMRYSINDSMIYENMINITNVSTTINSFTIPARTNDTSYGNSNNATFWKLQIPTGISGECNGTVIFQAIDANQ